MDRQELPELYPGWKTVRRIGAGSYGTVYEIERDLFGKTEKAALKYISIPRSEGDVQDLYSIGYDNASITAHFKDHLANIVREYSLMAEMKGHTNVVYCDDIRYIQHDDGFGWDIYIKMELLTPVLKVLDKPFGDEQVVKLGMDICNALVLCKGKGIIHRDIKPQNLFISDTGDYKLGDFGIAKAVEQTTGGTKIGTYNYMAPEVYNNQPYGSAADICSLGLVMYWLLNERRLPFLPMPPKVPTVAEFDAARMRRFSGEPIPAPANGSGELKRIVLKACAFDPKERYQSAREMLQELKALENGTVSNVVHEKESQKAETVPAYISEAAEEPNDGTMTVGPVWGQAPADSSDETEGTVGPVFTPRGGQEYAPRAEQERLHREKEEQCETDQLPDQSVSKKKKPLWLWAAVAALVVIVIGFLTIHVSTEATCTRAPVCKICGKVTGRALEHKWREATCTSPKTCYVCGTTTGSAAGHQWIAATYSSPQRCNVCAATEGDALTVPPIFLNELGVMSGHEGKVWTRGTNPPSGAFHTNADARATSANGVTCWGDWSTPGHTTGTVKDQYGNVYTYGIFIDGRDSQAYYMEFYLGGKYTKFSGTCACPDRDSAVFGSVYSTSNMYSKQFEVYLDGVYAGSSPIMRHDYAPQKFEFDVTGVQVLRIVYPSTNGPNEVASIYDGLLS